MGGLCFIYGLVIKGVLLAFEAAVVEIIVTAHHHILSCQGEGGHGFPQVLVAVIHDGVVTVGLHHNTQRNRRIGVMVGKQIDPPPRLP